MTNQSRIPLLKAIQDHIDRNPISFHVPGHKNGLIFEETARLFQSFLQMDVTELAGLDDLHSPEGPILEAEVLLAELYKVDKSFLLINGSTVGNLAMIMAACNEGDRAIVQRNCHKSILNALKLAKVNPIFLQPEYDFNWKVASGVRLETVKEAIQLYPDAKAIILTYPNYYGMVYDLQAIIEEAHNNHIPVLVDEAHGAHFAIGSPFPVSAAQMGADIIVQSAHKTLPAMTMGSYLHVNSDMVCLDKLEEYLHTFQSSSPSYPIMASLDIARHYLAHYDKKDSLYLQNQIDHFKEKLAEIPGIKVLGHQKGQGDPLRIILQSQCGLTGFELQKKLEEQGIYTELADPNNVLFILPLLKESEFYRFKETAAKIKNALSGLTDVIREDEYYILGEKLSELAISYKDMANYKVTTVQIDDALNYICAEMITPYPPGIPLLIKGERITKDKLKSLKKLIETGARFQQGASLEEGLIQVFGGLKG